MKIAVLTTPTDIPEDLIQELADRLQIDAAMAAFAKSWRRG
jgi:hypothetical protein